MKVKKKNGKIIFNKVSDVEKRVGKNIRLRGWVYRIRKSNKFVFVVLRDSTGIVQCVIKSDNPHFNEAKKATIESSISLDGVVKQDKRAPTGYEVQVEDFRIIHIADTFPITEYQSTEFLLDVRHLWIRSLKLNRVFKIRSTVLNAIRDFFKNKGFYEIQSPSITSSACESGSLFEINYFGKKAYLTQSWQLYAEAMIFSLENIFCIAPSFRAEKSRTRRHLAEYWHAEAEAAWLNHKDNMLLQQDLIWFVIQEVIKNNAKELKELGRNPEELAKMKPPYKIITYDEALAMLEKGKIELKWGEDLGAIHEKALTKHFNKPFFVELYPRSAKAFYMKENPDNPKTVLCNDMFAPEGYGEIIGGSEREPDLKKLIRNLKEKGENPRNYEWYLDLRRYGSVPHSGFGLGVERLLMWLCKLDHIRDAIAFPRVLNRSYP